jgi:hypothetical protein
MFEASFAKINVFIPGAAEEQNQNLLDDSAPGVLGLGRQTWDTFSIW